MNTERPHTLQQKIFQALINRIGNTSIVPILCELLHLSKTAVYDRLSGKKVLTLVEMEQILDSFSLHLDDIRGARPDRVSFSSHSIHSPVKNAEEYMKALHESVVNFAQIPSLQVWFSSPSLPFFHHMHFRELALFKLFAYARINWQLPYTEHLKFHPDTFPERRVYETYMADIIKIYATLPSIEFCSDDSYYHTIRQIQYFSASNQIEDPTVTSILLEQLASLCNHQQEMAKSGCKWVYQTKKNLIQKGGKLDLYYNEITPVTISILLESPASKGVFTVLDDPNFMYSDNSYLYDYTLKWMHGLRAKCINMSEGAEKDRRVYFNVIMEQINQLPSSF